MPSKGLNYKKEKGNGLFVNDLEQKE